MSSADAVRATPRILCTGIIVLDEVFRVERFPQPDGKVQTDTFFIVSGGCAANAAVAIARLGARAALASPMGGPAGADPNGDLVLDTLIREKVDCSACQRIPGLATALSAIFIDRAGDRMIVTYRDERVAKAVPADPERLVATADIVLADNRYPAFVEPVCAAARARGLPVVLDGDRPTVEDDPLFRLASHVIFSSECLRETTGIADLGAGLQRIARNTAAFLAVSNGPNAIVYLDRGRVGAQGEAQARAEVGAQIRHLPVFAIAAVDTLGAGDAFHAGFTLALAEGRDEVAAMRFGAAVAGIKCTRLGGSAGAPDRGEVEAFLAENGAQSAPA